jgi:predicted NBD/HSP70 family sugar kinase
VIVGVDMRDRALHTVVADDGGGVIKRDRRAATTDALTDALRTVDARAATAIGIAARNPHDPELRDIVSRTIDAAAASVAHRLVSHGSGVAIAEHWCGAARGYAHVVALNADSGVDAGIVINNESFEGAHHVAGAAGWLALNPVERDDYRRFGCLEAEVSAHGIVRRLIWRVKAGDSSAVLDLAGGDFNDITVDHVLTAARSGDGVAISVVRDTARYLGMAIANVVVMLDPDIVVLGGLIPDAADLLLAACRTEASRRLPTDMDARLKLVAGTLGQDAAALGAARAAMLAP